MLCLKFPIPPIPQLLTVGHGVWQPGNQHFERTFAVYDLLLVKQGTLYMKEAAVAYELNAGDLLVLEPGKTHWGHLPCVEETEVYWVHWVHGAEVQSVQQEDIDWSGLISRGTDQDLAPSHLQHLYVPKAATISLYPVTSILDEMNDIHNRLNTESAIRLHLLMAQLLTALQSECSPSGALTPSQQVSHAAADYLNQRWRLPFDSAAMEEQLHFQFDYIIRCMKKHLGKTPLQYVLHLRLEETKKLLSQTVLSIAEIGEQVGITDSNYLVRLFTSRMGVSPGKYRRRQQSGF